MEYSSPPKERGIISYLSLTSNTPNKQQQFLGRSTFNSSEAISLIDALRLGTLTIHPYSVHFPHYKDQSITYTYPASMIGKFLKKIVVEYKTPDTNLLTCKGFMETSFFKKLKTQTANTLHEAELEEIQKILYVEEAKDQLRKTFKETNKQLIDCFLSNNYKEIPHLIEQLKKMRGAEACLPLETLVLQMQESFVQGCPIS